MTTSRIVRGNKCRVFLYICGILVIVGVIACYNNTRVQLDDVQRTNELCRKQQENLSSQLQAIFEYKQRLEKSLKAEKADHQQTKSDLQNKLNEQKLQHEKEANESKVRLTSLQQHNKLLERQFSDFKEETGKFQKQQLEEINYLQSKLHDMKNTLKQLQNEKESLVTELKETQAEKQIALENVNKFKDEINRTKAKMQAEENSYIPKTSHYKRTEMESLNFSKQITMDDSTYQLKDAKDRPLELKQEFNLLPDSNNDETNQMAAPKINYVANNSQNVLPVPNSGDAMNVKLEFKSSTKTNSRVSKSSLDVAPLRVPTVTPETKPKSSSQKTNQKLEDDVLPLPYKRKLPEGVVPIPPKTYETQDEEKNEIAEDVNAALPGRYRNNIIANEIDDEKNKFNNEIGDKENGAHEVMDFQLNKDKNKQHIDALAAGAAADEGDFEKNEEVEGDEDDDADEYGQKEPAIRN